MTTGREEGRLASPLPLDWIQSTFSATGRRIESEMGRTQVDIDPDIIPSYPLYSQQVSVSVLLVPGLIARHGLRGREAKGHSPGIPVISSHINRII